MATDATGTPTSPDSIPTYNVNADDPTGNGFNAAMAAIQTALSARASKPSGIVTGEVPVWNGSTWVRSSVTNIGPTSLGSGSPSSSNFLRGDGTWASAGVTTTTSTIAGGPPGSPADKDVWIATAVDGNGTRWAFQYNASSGSSFKWEFIGGFPAISGTGTGTTVSTVFVADPSASFTVPRGGDYWIDGIAVATTNAATWTVGIGVGTQTIQWANFENYVGGGAYQLPFKGILTGLSTSGVIQVYLKNNTGAVATNPGSIFNVTPRRIS